MHDLNEINFAKWIHNNWYIPCGLPNIWILKKNPTDLLSKDKRFTTEKLHKLYKKSLKNEIT